MREVLIYLLAVAVAAVVTVMVASVWGIILHFVILITIILRASWAGQEIRQGLLLSLALVPLVRIISLAMPLAGIPEVWRYPIVYTPLLVATVIVVRILNIRARDIGLKVGSFPLLQLLVALSGFIIGGVEYLILKPEPMVAELTWWGIWPWILVMLVCTGFVEEFIFRGVMQHTALTAFGWWGIVYVSVIFAVLHVGFLSVIDVIFIFVVALFFGFVVKRTGSLLGVTLSHGLANSILFVVLPLLLE